MLVALHLLSVSHVPQAYAAYYRGGSEDGYHELAIYLQTYRGGSNDGAAEASSGDQIIGFGQASQLAFATSPSTAKVSKPFSRQPVVEIQDATGNRVLGDSTTSVTLNIHNNPGNSRLNGTKTLTAVNGVVNFTDIFVNAGAC